MPDDERCVKVQVIVAASASLSTINLINSFILINVDLAHVVIVTSRSR